MKHLSYSIPDGGIVQTYTHSVMVSNQRRFILSQALQCIPFAEIRVRVLNIYLNDLLVSRECVCILPHFVVNISLFQPLLFEQFNILRCGYRWSWYRLKGRWG